MHLVFPLCIVALQIYQDCNDKIKCVNNNEQKRLCVDGAAFPLFVVLSSPCRMSFVICEETMNRLLVKNTHNYTKLTRSSKYNPHYKRRMV